MNNPTDEKPGDLPKMTHDEVKARAQRIFDRWGEPPYKSHFPESALGHDEVAIISEFVTYWRPMLKVNPPRLNSDEQR
jgi:hypothetical protein